MTSQLSATFPSCICSRTAFRARATCETNSDVTSFSAVLLRTRPLLLPLKRPYCPPPALVRLAEHVQFPPNSQRIPGQPAEHASRGSPRPLPRSLHSPPCSLLPDSSKHSWKRASTPFYPRYTDQQFPPFEAKQWLNSEGKNDSPPSCLLLPGEAKLGASLLRRSSKSRRPQSSTGRSVVIRPAENSRLQSFK